MAAAAKPEFTPLLKPGFHQVDIDGLKRLCVDRFAASITRQSIMANLAKLIGVIQNAGMRGEIWVDGSFLTEKLNPEDVDLLLVVSLQTFLTMNATERKFFDWYSQTNLKAQYGCDNYAFVRDDKIAEAQWLHAYWLRQFGFSRGDQMKGLAVVKIPFVVTP